MEKSAFVQITRQSKIAEDEFYPMIAAMFEEIWRNLLPPQIMTNDLTTRRARNVVTPADAPIPDCVTCGACCAAMLCVGVRPHEEIGAENFWDITISNNEGKEITVDRFLRRDGETLYCAALDVPGDGRALCRIYEQRPQMCRDFEAGSDKCHALRRAYGFEPFLSVEEMIEALQKLDEAPAAANLSETIREVKFIATESGALEVKAFLKDGAELVIHAFDPQTTTWRQSEFDGLTLSQAAALIAERRA